MSEFVRIRQDGVIFEIILNRPEKRNAIHWPMMVAIAEAIKKAERASGIRGILIRGEGGGFSSGIDLLAFPELAEAFGENWQDHMLWVTDAFQSVLNTVNKCHIPTIALLQGYALGLGFELALACDFRIATRHTKISLPEARLGLIPDVGGTTRLTRLVGPARAKEIIMTGRMIDLSLAEKWGIVNYVVSGTEALEKKGKALIQEIALAAPLAVSYAKRVIDEIADLNRGLRLEAWAQNQLIHTQDFQIGVQSALTKTAPEWRGK